MFSSGKSFSTGGDLDFLLRRHSDTPESNHNIMLDFYSRFLVLRRLPVPVVAAVNGPAIGAGLCLALGGADIRIAQHEVRSCTMCSTAHNRLVAKR